MKRTRGAFSRYTSVATPLQGSSTREPLPCLLALNQSRSFIFSRPLTAFSLTNRDANSLRSSTIIRPQTTHIQSRNTNTFSPSFRAPTRRLILDDNFRSCLAEYKKTGNPKKALQIIAEKANDGTDTKWQDMASLELIRIALELRDAQTGKELLEKGFGKHEKIESYYIQILCASGNFSEAVRLFESTKAKGLLPGGNTVRGLLSYALVYDLFKGKQIVESIDPSVYHTIHEIRIYRLATEIYRKLGEFSNEQRMVQKLEQMQRDSEDDEMKESIKSELLSLKAHRSKDLAGALELFCKKGEVERGDYHAILHAFMLDNRRLEEKIRLVQQELGLEDIHSPLFSFYYPDDKTAAAGRQSMKEQWLKWEEERLQNFFDETEGQKEGGEDEDDLPWDLNKAPFDWIYNQTEEGSEKRLPPFPAAKQFLRSRMKNPKKAEQQSPSDSEGKRLSGIPALLQLMTNIVEHMKYNLATPNEDSYLLILRNICRHHKYWDPKLEKAIWNTLYIMQEEMVIPDLNFYNTLLSNIAQSSGEFRTAWKYYRLLYNPKATPVSLEAQMQHLIEPHNSKEEETARSKDKDEDEDEDEDEEEDNEMFVGRPSGIDERHLRFAKLAPDYLTFSILLGVCDNKFDRRMIGEHMEKAKIQVTARLSDTMLGYLARDSWGGAVKMLRANVAGEGRAGIKPTAATLRNVMAALPKTDQALEAVELAILPLIESDKIQPDLDLFNTTIETLLPSNWLTASPSANAASATLNGILSERKALGSTTAMKQCKLVLRLFEMMKTKKVNPDIKTFQLLATLLPTAAEAERTSSNTTDGGKISEYNEAVPNSTLDSYTLLEKLIWSRMEESGLQPDSLFYGRLIEALVLSDELVRAEAFYLSTFEDSHSFKTHFLMAWAFLERGKSEEFMAVMEKTLEEQKWQYFYCENEKEKEARDAQRNNIISSFERLQEDHGKRSEQHSRQKAKERKREGRNK